MDLQTSSRSLWPVPCSGQGVRSVRSLNVESLGCRCVVHSGMSSTHYRTGTGFDPNCGDRAMTKTRADCADWWVIWWVEDPAFNFLVGLVGYLA